MITYFWHYFLIQYFSIIQIHFQVYDPKTDSWSTVGKIPEAFLTSDNGAFASPDGSTIFVVGGYNQNYFAPDALATTFSFETQAALDQLTINTAMRNDATLGDLACRLEADLITGRGDIHAVSSEDGKKAYVAGGSAGMCQPLTSAEVYDFETKTWSSAGDLLKARADGAIVQAAGTIFAIGGEVNHPDQCAAPELVPPLSHQSLAVDDVEALDYGSIMPGTPPSVWNDVGYIPEFRFRFSAASWPSTGVAYAFGGETSFDDNCSCFPTTTEIFAIDSGMLLGGSIVSTFDDDEVSSVSDGGDGEEEEDSYDGEIIDLAAGNGLKTAASLVVLLNVLVAMIW